MKRFTTHIFAFVLGTATAALAAYAAEGPYRGDNTVVGSVVVNTPNLERAAAYYNLLGMKEMDHRGDKPARVVQFNMSSKAGRFTGGVSLHETTEAAPPVGTAFSRTIFLVKDVAAVCKKLGDAKMPCDPMPRPVAIDNNALIANAKDPDGRAVELIQEP